jgi:hypothetical protein
VSPEHTNLPSTSTLGAPPWSGGATRCPRCSPSALESDLVRSSPIVLPLLTEKRSARWPPPDTTSAEPAASKVYDVGQGLLD